MRIARNANWAWTWALSILLIVVYSGCSTGDAADTGGASDQDAGSDAKADARRDVIYDHVNDINGCNPSTCAGCCDDEGKCRTGLEGAACGAGGYACVDCAAFTAACNAATRECGPSNCVLETCPYGCCADGVCMDGTDPLACGRGGAACKACDDGTTCDHASGMCVVSPDCGPWNCEGCCDASGTCKSGGEVVACGAGGSFCEDCSAMGAACDPDHGCIAPPSCAPSNCDGCCTDAIPSQCLPGLSDTACGHGGQICESCSKSHAFCDDYGSGGPICRYHADSGLPPDSGP